MGGDAMTTKTVAMLLAGALLALGQLGCATTSRDDRAAEPTWRRAEPAAPGTPAATADSPLTVYVAGFGLSESVLAEHPELAEAQAGLGLGPRIADALFATRRFRFLEEKAEIAGRLAELLERGSAGAVADPDAPPAGAPEEARWLLYGEIAGLEVERRERVAGVAARTEVETRVTVQIRLLDRDTRRLLPATGTGSAVTAGFPVAAGLDPSAVGEATEAAVRRAADELVGRLEPPPGDED
jgi:hypothetical protein